jgi:hypothetical protein
MYDYFIDDETYNIELVPQQPTSLQSVVVEATVLAKLFRAEEGITKVDIHFHKPTFISENQIVPHMPRYISFDLSNNKVVGVNTIVDGENIFEIISIRVPIYADYFYNDGDEYEHAYYKVGRVKNVTELSEILGEIPIIRRGRDEYGRHVETHSSLEALNALNPITRFAGVDGGRRKKRRTLRKNGKRSKSRR